MLHDTEKEYLSKIWDIMLYNMHVSLCGIDELQSLIVFP